MSNIFAILCLFSHQHRVRRKNQPRLKSNKERIQKISAKRTRFIEDLENRFGQHIWSAAPSLFQLYRNMDWLLHGLVGSLETSVWAHVLRTLWDIYTFFCGYGVLCLPRSGRSGHFLSPLGVLFLWWQCSNIDSRNFQRDEVHLFIRNSLDVSLLCVSMLCFIVLMLFQYLFMFRRSYPLRISSWATKWFSFGWKWVTWVYFRPGTKFSQK